MNSVGIILTILFTPEPLRVPLAELDRRYRYHSAGKVYHGVLPSPRHRAAHQIVSIATCGTAESPDMGPRTYANGDNSPSRSCTRRALMPQCSVKQCALWVHGSITQYVLLCT